MAEQTLKEKTAKGLFWGGLSNGVQQVLNALFGLILARFGCIRLRNGWNVGNL